MSPRPTSSPAAGLAGTRRREQRLLLVLALVLMVLLAGGVVAHRALVGPAAAPSVGPSTTADQQPTDVRVGRPLLLGEAGAPVTLTLYEDFRCPHCADLQRELGPTLHRLRDAGTLKVDLMPMAFVDDASAPASNAVACAAQAGFGAAYADGLFADVRDWTPAELVDLGTTVAAARADAAFARCVTADAHADWVASVNRAADTAGVRQTPTAFLDGASVDIAGLTPKTLTDMVAKAAQP